MLFSPIVIFVYNRPDHTRKTLEGLMTNAEFSKSPVYIYCDGPKHDKDTSSVYAVREAIRSYSLPNVTMIEQPHNLGLANSIISGVTEVCNQHGRVIVMEDDLLVSHFFLAYMNEALNRYAENKQVMQVIGHCFPALGYSQSQGSSFLPFSSSLGWGTWKRAWDYFDAELKDYEQVLTDIALRKKFNLNGAYSYTGMIDKLSRKGQLNRSWAVRWYWSIFRQNGLALFPHRTLVLHFGDDNSGTNCRGKQPPIDIEFALDNTVAELPKEVVIDEAFYSAVQKTLSKQQSLWNKGIRYIRRWL